MAKFLNFFENNEQRSTYELSDKYVSPYVSAIKDVNGGGENLIIMYHLMCYVY